MLEMAKFVGGPGNSVKDNNEIKPGSHYSFQRFLSNIIFLHKTDFEFHIICLVLVCTLTRGYTRRYGGCRGQAVAFGCHGCHLNGVSRERGEPRHPVLLSQVGQIMGHPAIGPVELLPGDAITWKQEWIPLSKLHTQRQWQQVMHCYFKVISQENI